MRTVLGTTREEVPLIVRGATQVTGLEVTLVTDLVRIQVEIGSTKMTTQLEETSK